MSEHPNNQRNRDRAKGCYATFHFRDGSAHSMTFMPTEMSSLWMDDCETREKLWMYGAHQIPHQLNQKFIYTHSCYMNVSEIVKVSWEEFVPIWICDVPGDPSKEHIQVE